MGIVSPTIVPNCLQRGIHPKILAEHQSECLIGMSSMRNMFLPNAKVVSNLLNWMDSQNELIATHRRGHYLQTASLFRLRVVADDDSGAIAPVTERFQNLNIVPRRRVVAEFGIDQVIHIDVDISELPEKQLTVIAAKITKVLRPA